MAHARQTFYHRGKRVHKNSPLQLDLEAITFNQDCARMWAKGPRYTGAIVAQQNAARFHRDQARTLTRVLEQSDYSSCYVKGK